MGSRSLDVVFALLTIKIPAEGVLAPIQIARHPLDLDGCASQDNPLVLYLLCDFVDKPDKLPEWPDQFFRNAPGFRSTMAVGANPHRGICGRDPSCGNLVEFESPRKLLCPGNRLNRYRDALLDSHA